MVNPQTGVLVFPRLGGQFLLDLDCDICTMQPPKVLSVTTIWLELFAKYNNWEICAKDFNLGKDEMVVKSNGAVSGAKSNKILCPRFFYWTQFSSVCSQCSDPMFQTFSYL